MSDVLRGRELRPRVTRKPSPGLAARMKMLEADAEKRRLGIVGDAAAAAKMEIARSGPKNKDGFSTDNLTIVDEGMEGGVRSNGVGGCNGGAITSIIHTYNSQPAALTAPPSTNGAVGARNSDGKRVAIATEPSSKHDPKKSSSTKAKRTQHIEKRLPLPTQEECIPDHVEASNIAVEPVTDEHDIDGNIPEDDTDNTTLPQTQGDQPPDELPEPEPEFVQQEIYGEATDYQIQLEKYLKEEGDEIEEQEVKVVEQREVQQMEDDKVIEHQTQEGEGTEEVARPEEPVIIQVPSATEVSQEEVAKPEEPVIIPVPSATEVSQEEVAKPEEPVIIQVPSAAEVSQELCNTMAPSSDRPITPESPDSFRPDTANSTMSSETQSASAEQILRWIDTAKTVLKGLDAEDDVEWAAQGKKSLAEVDVAVGKFSNLVKVYVSAIDELQERDDSPSVSADIFKDVVETMEIILYGWKEVEELLRGVKGQVETAMEWNELWTTILQDIQAEIEACQTIVFEIEEKRHRSLMEENVTSSRMDIDALATIVEDSPRKVNGQPPSEEDASLLKLFARMQPLRASLDFLPMRLASFQSRAEGVFPSACEDLESRRKLLEKKWQKLNGDAEEMKRELGEDKWVAIFRNAGKQATQMIDSVDRSLKKLKDAVNHFKDGHDLSTDSGIHKKVEAYEAKRVHYGPAIQRVLAIIDKGVSDRLTVNGEILRLHTAMHKRWRHMEQEMSITDEVLHDLNLHASQQVLRDSVSTIVSMDARSPNSMIHTPGSSPASSIVLSSPANTAKSSATVQRRSGSAAGQYAKVSRGALGPSSATSNTPRAKLPSGRTNSNTFGNILSPTSSRGASPSPNSQRMSGYNIPSPGNSGRPSATSARSTSSLDNRPRWNISVNTNDLDTGHHFKPLSLTTPSSEHRRSPRSSTLSTPGTKTRIPIPSPLRYPTPTPGQSPSLNPIMSSPTYKYSQNTGSKRASIYGASGFIRSPMTSPRSVSGTSSQGGLDIPMRPELRSRQSIPNLADDQVSNATTSAVRHARPASAMGSARRATMQLRPRSPSAQSTSGAPNGIPEGDSGSYTASGRVSRAKRMSMPPKALTQQAQDNKPRWK